MIPLIREDTLAHAWLSEQGFNEAIAVAGMAPGPIALNSAVMIGYRADGLVGAIGSAIGILLPSIVVIVLLAVFLRKAQEHPVVRAIFYGLRPAVAALIVFAAYRLAFSGEKSMAGTTWHAVALAVMMVAAFVALLRFRFHPLGVIVVSGLLGIALFS
jgi:chromate transporter